MLGRSTGTTPRPIQEDNKDKQKYNHIKNKNMRTLVKRIIGTLGTGALMAGLIIGANAHDKKEEVKVNKVDPEFIEWHFDGAPNPSNNDLTDPSQYSKGSSTTCDGEKETICNLNAPENGSSGQPDLNATVTIPGQPSESVSQRISDALGSGTPNETVQSFRSE